MSLEKAIEHAAEHLPEGWTIHIAVERGAGWVNAERPDGSMVDMREDDTDFAEQVNAVVRLAHDEAEADKLSVDAHRKELNELPHELRKRIHYGLYAGVEQYYIDGVDGTLATLGPTLQPYDHATLQRIIFDADKANYRLLKIKDNSSKK